MSWVLLITAIFSEVIATVAMKQSQGFGKLLPSILLVLLLALSLGAETLALKKLELSTCYIIWMGLGTLLIIISSVVFFDETLSFSKIVFISVTFAGVLGLSFSR